MLLAESRRAAGQVVQEALRLLEEPTLSSCAGSAGAPPLAQLLGVSPAPPLSSCDPDSGSQHSCVLRSPGDA